MVNQSANRIINECISEIDSIKIACKRFKKVDKEIDYFTKYLIIHVSGALEECYKTLIADYCMRHSNASLHVFFENTITKKSKNATLSNIYEILGLVKPTLKSNFKTKLKAHSEYDQIESSLDSLSTLRHGLAHGKTLTQVYLSDVEQYFQHAQQMISILDDLLNEDILQFQLAF